MSRTARLERQTKESKVLVELDLDGSGRADVSTGVGFYDHMLTSARPVPSRSTSMWTVDSLVSRSSFATRLIPPPP